jgi:hypothetical protein
MTQETSHEVLNSLTDPETSRMSKQSMLKTGIFAATGRRRDLDRSIHQSESNGEVDAIKNVQA